mmetsp:Transcript_115320/g.326772  ORF Transcript_115320/g.326772 Transcript_115320/m.326772 type:complete len:364 (-) Transcript_115320:7-1098(-)
MTTCPGLLAVSVSPPLPLGTFAAMERESFPPSMLTPSWIMTLLSSSAVSYILGPSPLNFAAHIQLPEAFTESSEGIFTQTRLVRASATVSRAILWQLARSPTRPFSGCSPMAVAPPLTPKGLCAIAAKSARGVWSGPTHCCWAMTPVTERSTLFVRKRLDPTERSRRTPRVSAACTAKPTGMESASGGAVTRSMGKVFCGIFPRTLSSGRSTGFEPSRVSRTTTRPSPVTVPTTEYGARSRRQMSPKSDSFWGSMSSALFSWNSAIQSSSTDMDGSPTSILRMSMSAPAGSAISFRTLPEPPAPWSWIDRMGLSGPSSTQARTTRFTFCCISASPRCTALKSSSAALSPEAIEEAAPPPTPIR